MSLGDSASRDVERGMPGMQPWRSRSTFICGMCLVTLIVIAELAMIAGYFNESFAGSCLVLLSTIIGKVFDQQTRSDETKIPSQWSVQTQSSGEKKS